MLKLQTSGAIAANQPLMETPGETSLARKNGHAPEDVFTTLVEKCSDMAYNVALRMLRNPADAEDAVQEAFISAYRALPSFKGQSRLSTWLYRIVVNICLMRIRKNKTRAKYLTLTGYDDVIVPDWSNDPEKAAVNSELRGVLETGLNKLPPDLRAAVILRDVRGFSTEEAAQILQLTIPALKSQLQRGRVLLRKYLEPFLARSA